MRTATLLAAILLAAGACAAPPVTMPAARHGSGGTNDARWLDAPYVVLVSFDAFRWDYPDRGLTPNLDRLAARGVRADALIPMFPSKTFANHYSIATGMSPGHNGIVANNFYDPAFDATYRLSDRSTVEDGRWYGGEPIWVTAEMQGMVTAAMFFVGTEAPVKGIQPTYWNKFDANVTEDTRIRTVLDWLGMPADKRPHLITLYFERLDNAGHWYGPDSPELNRALAGADSIVGRLMDGIDALPWGDRVNLVILTDHGMAPLDRPPVELEDWADLTGVRIMTAGPLAQLYVGGDTARARSLRDSLDRAPGMSAFLPDETPASWRTGRNPRFGDVLLVADEGVQIRRRGQTGERTPATHGWPPSRSMYGIFFTAGPGIRPGTHVPPFENIHVYPFLAALLGLEPAGGIDGTLDPLRPILTGPAANARRR
ncbi:MAG: ectonucleotide pyrophosphatase/phosphodiesterase [Gemmatimonadota bacterium]